MIITNVENCSIGDVLRIVLAGHERTAFVLDELGKVTGVFTEGDLLRLLWNGIDLEAPAVDFMNHNPRCLLANTSNKRATAIAEFVENGTLSIPVIDTERKLIEVLNIRNLLRAEP